MRACALRVVFERALVFEATLFVVLRTATFLRERVAVLLARVLRVVGRLADVLLVAFLAAGFRLLVGLRAVLFLVVLRLAERLRVLARFCVLERFVVARFNEPPANATGDGRHISDRIVPTRRASLQVFSTDSRTVVNKKRR